MIDLLSCFMDSGQQKTSGCSSITSRASVPHGDDIFRLTFKEFSYVEIS